ncbi:MAG: hypothetical protein ACRDU9_08930, partial [Acidimicrobiia bacterium]
MPYPNHGNRLSPEELAKLVAEHLGETPVPTKRFSVRNSVLLGRLISGAVAMASAAVLVLAIFVGVNWVFGGPVGALPGQGNGPDPIGLGSDEDATTSTVAVEVLSRSFTSDVLGGGYVIIAESGGPFPALPPPVTNPISPGSSTTAVSSTASSVTTSSSSPATSTTSSPPTTNTTVATTTTTLPATTTTTEPTTTSTC